MSAASPRVVLGGVPLNKAPYLPAALESLLSQTYEDFALLLLDDGSTDETEEIARRYAAEDPRIHYSRNPRRLGLVRNWRRAYELSVELFPGAEYFAWVSDHDVWHPRWLESLVRELERGPEVVLAYPYNLRISDSGAVRTLPWAFDTAGVGDPARRLALASRGMVAGDMIYGLFRRASLGSAGVFRGVVHADRLTLAEVALRGEFRQVPEVLWYRRFRWTVSSAAQRGKFFPEGIPAYSRLPWSVQHAGAMAWNLGVRGAAAPALGRAEGVRSAARYQAMNARHQVTQKARKLFHGAGNRAIALARAPLMLLTHVLAHATGHAEMLPEPIERDRLERLALVNRQTRAERPAPTGTAVRLLARLLASPAVVGHRPAPEDPLGALDELALPAPAAPGAAGAALPGTPGDRR